jgi:hypothetical protein
MKITNAMFFDKVLARAGSLDHGGLNEQKIRFTADRRAGKTFAMASPPETDIG